MDKVRVGIIGFGNMGSGHFGNIKAGRCPEIVVTAVADVKPYRLEAFLAASWTLRSWPFPIMTIPGTPWSASGAGSM